MHDSWKALERSLRRQAATSDGRQLRDLADHDARSIESFEDARQVLSYLHAIDGSDEGRDRLLAELAVASRSQDSSGRLAQSILWLALWPGLSAILKPALRRSSADGAEVVADLVEKFALAVQRFDPDRATRTAATLLWNTRRLFWASQKREQVWRDSQSPRGAAALGALIDDSAAGEDLVLAVLDLRRDAGLDVDLLLSCALDGLSVREAAAEHGLRHEAAKKRIQRVVARFRAREGLRPRSKSRSRGRVPVSKGAPHIEGMGEEPIAGAPGGEEAETDESTPFTVSDPSRSARVRHHSRGIS